MDFSALLADLRDVAEKYKGQTTEPEVASHAYADMFTQILKKTQKMTESYEDQMTMFRVALNQLASIYKDLAQGTYRDLLINYIFGMCARTVLNIQWSQLDESNETKANFVSTVQTAHEHLKPQGYDKFQLILNLMESQWTDPILTQIMASSADDDEIEDAEEYIKNEDPQILTLRIEIMMKENCEEFALNLCEWSLKHPKLKEDLKIRENQIVILYRQADYTRMQEVCSQIVCHDGIHVMGRLAKNAANQDLCIRLAQVFLIQDWINPERNCCTQELLKLWIHHQYLADKDEERFLDSIWTVAKVCRTTSQIGVLIDGVKGECGDMFIQLYTELCKYALNIDKGNMEQEKAKGNKQEVDNRKQLLSHTCIRMAHMLKEYDFKMSRICGLTAFSLYPTSENLNLVNKLYWTIKHTSVTSGNSKIHPATVYEVERLLGLMRPEILNPDYSWKQLIPVCKRYQMTKGFNKPDLKKNPSGKRTYNKSSNKPNILSAMPQVKTTLPCARSSPENRKKQLEESPKSLQRAHAEQLLAQNKKLSQEKVSQLAREKFPKSKEQELAEGPPLTAKKLDNTINDLKKSIVLETQCSASLAKHLSPLAIKEEDDGLKGVNQSPASRGDQNQESHLNHSTNSLSKQNNKLQVPSPGQFISQDSSVPVQSPLPIQSVKSDPLPSFMHAMSKQPQSSQGVTKHQLSHQKSHPGHRKNLEDVQPKKQSKGHFNILRPPGSANQECAKIAQQIAEMHEKQRKEKETIERIRQQGKIDGSKFAMNSRNIPSSSQISDLLTLTMKGKGGKVKDEVETEIPSVKGTEVVSRNVLERSNSNSTESAVIESGVLGGNSVNHVPPKQGLTTEKNYKKQKYYLATEQVMSNLKRDSTGNINIDDSNVRIKPVFSMVVPKSMTSPDNQQQLMKTVTNIVKQANIKPALGATHSVMDNKILSGNQLKSGTQTNGNAFYGTTSYNSPLFNMNTNTVPSAVQSNMNTEQYSPASITNTVYQSVIQSPLQTQYVTSQPILPNSANSMVPTQLNQNMRQTGDMFMAVGSDATYQNLNNSVPVLSQPSMNQHMLNMQTGTSNVPQYQQYIQNPPQASHVDQHYLPQQTFSTTPHYGSQQTGYSPTLYHSPHSVMPGQPMSSQTNTIQQQSGMPVVHNNMQNFSSMQSIPMQSFSMAQNSPQPMLQIQSSSRVNAVVPQLSYNSPNTNEMTVSKNVPSVQSPVIGQGSSWHMNMGNVGKPQDSKSSVQQPAAKQFIAPPELSPAVVQQILSSLKQPRSSKVDRLIQQNARQNDQISANELEQSLTKEVIRQLALNKHDAHVKKSVMEATRKILELRKQYGHGSASTNTTPKASYNLAEVGKTNVPNAAVPDLPDLGSKEFEIDTILRLEENAQPSIEIETASIRQQSTGVGSNFVQVKSDKEMLRHIETFLETDAESSTVQKMQTQVEKILTNQNQPQSTYQNANRIAKERETTQLTELQYRRGKTEGAKIKCMYCEHYFKDNQQLMQHISRNLCQNYNPQMEKQAHMPTCHICKSAFRTLKELKDHVLNSCRAMPEKSKETLLPLRDFEYSLVYKCSNCNWMSAIETVSNKHVVNCSSNVINSPSKHPAKLNTLYKCLMCSDIFSDKEIMFKHVSKLCPQLKAKVGQEKAQESIDKLKSTNKLQLSTCKPSSTIQNHSYQGAVTSIKKDADDTKLKESLKSNRVNDKQIPNGDLPKCVNEKKLLNTDNRNMMNCEETNRDNFEDKSKTQIVPNTVVERKNDFKEQAESVNNHEMKRMKENFYLEQFTEIELKRKALKRQTIKNEKCDDQNENTDTFKLIEQELKTNLFNASTDGMKSGSPEIQSGTSKTSESQWKDTQQKDIRNTKSISLEGKTTDTLTKKRKLVNEPINRHHSDTFVGYTAKRRRKGKTIDIRKEKGLRAKRLIKQKRYLIDEMEPIPGDKRECKLCSFHQRSELLAKHYIERHDIGIRCIGNMLKCKYCIYQLPDTNKMKLKNHVIKIHLHILMKRIVEDKLDVASLEKEKKWKKGSPHTRSATGKSRLHSLPSSPGKSEKMKKHLKALAMREKCAENLQKIARKKLYTSEEEFEGNDEIYFTKDGETIEHSAFSENTTKTIPKNDRVILRGRAIRNKVINSDHKLSDTNVYRLRRGGGSDLNETVLHETFDYNASNRMRSRSNSQSSRSSTSMNDIPTSFKKDVGNNVGKIMLTRSGRRIRKPETDSSYVTESSNIEDEDFGLTDEEEQMKVGQQKRRRSRRNSRCSDRRIPTENHYSSESSDDGSIPRFTRPSGPKSSGPRRSQRDKSKKEESTKSEVRGEKGEKKGKGSRQTSVSDDEYLSSATDITDTYYKHNQPNAIGDNLADRYSTSRETEIEIEESKFSSGSDSEAEKTYSLRRRKQSAVYKDYESSDIENDSENSGRVSKNGNFTHKESTGSLFTARRKSPRRASNISDLKHDDSSSNSKKTYVEEKSSQIKPSLNEERPNLSVLVGPDDDEFLGLKDIHNETVKEVLAAEIIEPVIVEREDASEPNGTVNVLKNVAVMESEDEFAFLKSHEPNYECKLKEKKPVENPKIAAFNTEFQKFTSQRNLPSDQESSESDDVCDEEDQGPVLISQGETEDNIGGLEDVPVLVNKTDFVSAFHKFAQSQTKNCTESEDTNHERAGGKCEGFLGAYQEFFDEHNTNQNRKRKSKQRAKPEKIDYKRKFGIVECYVKLFRLQQKTIDTFRNKSKGKSTSKKKALLLIDSENSSDTENEGINVKVRKTKDFSNHILGNKTIKQEFAVPEYINSSPNIEQHYTEKVELNDYKGNHIDLSNIEDDPDYVWIENAESVAEQSAYNCDEKEQEQQIVILTEPNQDDVCHNPNVVELCVTDASETSVDNFITIVDDCLGCEENEQVSDLDNSNIVFIEVQDEDELIIAHGVENIDRLSEEINVVIGESNIEEGASVLKVKERSENTSDQNASINSNEKVIKQEDDTKLVMHHNDQNTAQNQFFQHDESERNMDELEKTNEKIDPFKDGFGNEQSSESMLCKSNRCCKVDSQLNSNKSTCEDASCNSNNYITDSHNILTDASGDDIDKEVGSELLDSSNPGPESISLTYNPDTPQNTVCNKTETSSKHPDKVLADENPNISMCDTPDEMVDMGPISGAFTESSELVSLPPDLIEVDPSVTVIESDDCDEDNSKTHFYVKSPGSCSSAENKVDSNSICSSDVYETTGNKALEKITGFIKQPAFFSEMKDSVNLSAGDKLNKTFLNQNLYLGVSVNICNKDLDVESKDENESIISDTFSRCQNPTTEDDSENGNICKQGDMTDSAILGTDLETQTVSSSQQGSSEDCLNSVSENAHTDSFSNTPVSLQAKDDAVTNIPKLVDPDILCELKENSSRVTSSLPETKKPFTCTPDSNETVLNTDNNLGPQCTLEDSTRVKCEVDGDLDEEKAIESSEQNDDRTDERITPKFIKADFQDTDGTSSVKENTNCLDIDTKCPLAVDNGSQGTLNDAMDDTTEEFIMAVNSDCAFESTIKRKDHEIREDTEKADTTGMSQQTSAEDLCVESQAMVGDSYEDYSHASKHESTNATCDELECYKGCKNKIEYHEAIRNAEETPDVEDSVNVFSKESLENEHQCSDYKNKSLNKDELDLGKQCLLLPIDTCEYSINKVDESLSVEKNVEPKHTKLVCVNGPKCQEECCSNKNIHVGKISEDTLESGTFEVDKTRQCIEDNEKAAPIQPSGQKEPMKLLDYSHSCVDGQILPKNVQNSSEVNEDENLEICTPGIKGIQELASEKLIVSHVEENVPLSDDGASLDVSSFKLVPTHSDRLCSIKDKANMEENPLSLCSKPGLSLQNEEMLLEQVGMPAHDENSTISEENIGVNLNDTVDQETVASELVDLKLEPEQPDEFIQGDSIKTEITETPKTLEDRHSSHVCQSNSPCVSDGCKTEQSLEMNEGGSVSEQQSEPEKRNDIQEKLISNSLNSICEYMVERRESQSEDNISGNDVSTSAEREVSTVTEDESLPSEEETCDVSHLDVEKECLPAEHEGASVKEDTSKHSDDIASSNSPADEHQMKDNRADENLLKDEIDEDSVKRDTANEQFAKGLLDEHLAKEKNIDEHIIKEHVADEHLAEIQDENAVKEDKPDECLSQEENTDKPLVKKEIPDEHLVEKSITDDSLAKEDLSNEYHAKTEIPEEHLDLNVSQTESPDLLNDKNSHGRDGCSNGKILESMIPSNCCLKSAEISKDTSKLTDKGVEDDRLSVCSDISLISELTENDEIETVTNMSKVADSSECLEQEGLMSKDTENNPNSIKDIIPVLNDDEPNKQMLEEPKISDFKGESVHETSDIVETKIETCTEHVVDKEENTPDKQEQVNPITSNTNEHFSGSDKEYIVMSATISSANFSDNVTKDGTKVIESTNTFSDKVDKEVKAVQRDDMSVGRKNGENCESNYFVVLPSKRSENPKSQLSNERNKPNITRNSSLRNKTPKDKLKANKKKPVAPVITKVTDKMKLSKRNIDLVQKVNNALLLNEENLHKTQKTTTKKRKMVKMEGELDQSNTPKMSFRNTKRSNTEISQTGKEKIVEGAKTFKRESKYLKAALMEKSTKEIVTTKTTAKGAPQDNTLTEDNMRGNSDLPETVGVAAESVNDGNSITDMEDEDELFKRRMESVKRARKKSTATPYESDFNFEYSSNTKAERHAIKQKESQSSKDETKDFKMTSTGNRLISEDIHLVTSKSPVKPRCFKDFTEEIKTQMRTRSKEIKEVKSVNSPSPLKSVIACDVKRPSDIADTKIFSPHIFTCDSVKKMKRRASLKKTFLSSISSPLTQEHHTRDIQQPSKHSKPCTQVNPEQPSKHSKPFTQVNPEQPSKHSKPCTQVDPEQPSKHSRPCTQVNPEQPSKHSKPCTQINPEQPSKHSKPCTQVNPEQPSKHGKPCTQVNPEQPSKHSKPCTQVNPEQPSKHSKPCTQVTPESKSHKKCVAVKDQSEFTKIKSPSHINHEHCDSLNIFLSSVQKGSSVKTSPSARTCPSVKTGLSLRISPSNETGSSLLKRKRAQKKSLDEAKEESKLHENLTKSCMKQEISRRGRRPRSSKSWPHNDSGVQVEMNNLSFELEPDLIEKQNNSRVSRTDKKDPKIDIRESIVKLGKRVKMGEDGFVKEAVCKVFKPDGTSGSPEKLGEDPLTSQCKHGETESKCDTCSNNRRSRTTSPKPLYDNDRKTVRHVLHGGKVFEITKGSVTEREFQATVETSPPSGATRRTRVSKTNMCSEPKELSELRTSGKRKNSNLNEYIHKTLKEIKKQRESSTLHHNWTMKKESNMKAPKFPYAFKKSRRN